MNQGLMDMGNEDATMSNDLWAESVGIPEYVCHKRVRAAKIIANVGLVEQAGNLIVLEGPNQGWPVSFEWLQKHKPEVGGYLVFYADGYVSYSPAKAFEEGYQLLTAQPTSVVSDK